MNSVVNMFDLISSQFHWLRPLWLMAIIPALVLAIALWRQKRNTHQWQQVIAPELLGFLLDEETTRVNRGKIWAVLLAWIIASFALAGPTWEKRPMPVEKNENALVIILDLSPSMLSEDIKPSRLVRARLKIADILREREDGVTALAVYAGEAHVVTPLTDDTATINSLLTSLHPNIMPLPGSNPESAIDLALRLLNDAGMTHGKLLLITDGVVTEAQQTINEKLGSNFTLSILGVGGDTPAPIPSTNGGFLRDDNRAIVTTRLNSNELRELARDNGGRYATLSNDGSDIKSLLSAPSPFSEENRKVEREFDNWYDSGHWLVFLLLPIVFYCFRRGILTLLLIAPALSLYSPDSSAMSWDDLWLTQDQQAQQQLQHGDAASAAEQFKHPEWKGSAQYRAGNYAAAADSFSHSDTAQAHYNRGNALAKAGKLDEAIKAYDAALQRDPSLQDAEANRKLVEAIKKQQEQQKQDQNENDQDKNDQDKKDQNKKDQKEDQNNKNSEQNSSDQNSQQNQDQQNSDQESSDNSSAGKDQTNQQEQQNSSGQQQSDAQNSSASDKPENKNKSDARQQSDQEAAQQSSASSQTSEGQMESMQQSSLSQEEQQAIEQWLRRVPDDPGGLLRNKFRYQYEQQRQQRQRNAWPTPGNTSDDRW